MELKGADMDIDLLPSDIDWEKDECPWNKKDNGNHKYAVKGTSICKYFQGIKKPDIVLCSYNSVD